MSIGGEHAWTEIPRLASCCLYPAG
jgi:hypothetical protein